MRKALRIIAVTSGIISVVSAFILGCVYLEDIVENVKSLKSKVVTRVNRLGNRRRVEEFDCE